MATFKTNCRLCLVRCGMVVETNDGAGKASAHAIPNVAPGDITRVSGDRDHPLSKGFLCIKGKASLDITNAAKRVIYPQRRIGERGSGQWERVGWDEALEDIAVRMNAIISEHGAKAVSVQSLPPKDHFVYNLFLKAIGSPTFFKHDSHNCFNPQMIADTLTFGTIMTYPGFISLEDCDVVLQWGVNLSETNGSKGFRVREAQRLGTRTIVVDPRLTASAREADLWLRIRPGTDAALALGMINVMISEGWYDKDFVAEWCEGFAGLAARAADYPPERVAEITWIPAADIHRAARMFATARSSAMYTYIGATMGGNSISTLRLMSFVPALTGKIDMAGNNRFLFPPEIHMPERDQSRDGEVGSGYANERLGAERFPLFSGPDAVSKPYPHPRQVIDAMLTGEPYPVRALWTDCNPMVGLEDTYAVLEALKSLDLLVVSELFESPTAHLADYILPMTTHLESNAVADHGGVNLLTARVRATEPRGEAREEAEPVLEVLQRMGYGDRVPVANYREWLDYQIAPQGMTFDEFKEKGVLFSPDEQLKYRNGKMRRDGKPGFNTGSGKIEFASCRLKEHGYDPLPDFVEPPYSPYSTPELVAEYPLILVTGTRSKEFYSTLGIEVPRLRKKRPFPSLEMSPETAAEFGLTAGDWVSIEAPTTDKAIKRQVAFMEGMHPQVVNAEGLWYMPGEDLVEGTLAVGANVLAPLRDDLDPIIGGSVARCLLCRIKKLPREEIPALAA